MEEDGKIRGEEMPWANDLWVKWSCVECSLSLLMVLSRVCCYCTVGATNDITELANTNLSHLRTQARAGKRVAWPSCFIIIYKTFPIRVKHRWTTPYVFLLGFVRIAGVFLHLWEIHPESFRIYRFKSFFIPMCFSAWRLNLELYSSRKKSIRCIYCTQYLARELSSFETYEYAPQPVFCSAIVQGTMGCHRRWWRISNVPGRATSRSEAPDCWPSAFH